MGTLVIRDLDDDVKTRLRKRAAANGRSMEAEARVILANAVTTQRPPQRLGTFIHERFAAAGGVDLPIPDRTGPTRRARPTSTTRRDRPRHQRRLRTRPPPTRTTGARLG